jgi:hypothetical protein
MKTMGEKSNSGGGKIMRRLTAIIVGFGLLMSADLGLAMSPSVYQTALCASITSSRPSASVLQRLGDEFFEQGATRALTDSPLAIRSAFAKQKDNRIYMVSRWYDLGPDERYTFSCEWIDPDGAAHSTTSASFETPADLDPGIYFTYTAYLNVHKSLKEGQWTVRIFVNGDLVETQDLTLSSE